MKAEPKTSAKRSAGMQPREQQRKVERAPSKRGDLSSISKPQLVDSIKRDIKKLIRS